MSKEPPKPRRRPARSRDVITACIEERIAMIAGNEEHVGRLRELLDELKRSGRKDESTEE